MVVPDRLGPSAVLERVSPGRAGADRRGVPLTLTTGRRPDAYNTGVRTRPDADDDGSATAARMHPETIADNLRAFDRGETVIESRRSAVTVGVAPDAHVPPGLVWLPVHNPAANRLTLSAADPESAEPNLLKQCAVALRAPDRTTTDITGSSGQLNGTGSHPRRFQAAGCAFSRSTEGSASPPPGVET